MAVPSNRSPSPVSSRTNNAHSRTPENNSTLRRSFTGNSCSRPSVLQNPRAFNPVTPVNSPADYARRVTGKEGMTSSWDFEEKENDLKAAKLVKPLAKGSKNFMSPTISAASKFTPSPRKKVLVERNDPVRTSILLSDGKATFFSANSSDATECQNQKPELSLEHSKNSGEVLDLKEEVVLASPSTTKIVKKKVTFLEVPLNCDDVPDSLSDTVTMDSDIMNDEPYSMKSSSNLDADPSLPPYDPKTNYLSPRPQFLHYKKSPRIEVLLNMEKGVDVEESKQLEDSFMSEVVSESFSDTDVSEGSQSEDSLKELEDVSSADMLSVAAVVEEEDEPKISEPADILSVAAVEEEEEEPKISEPAIHITTPAADEFTQAKTSTRPRFFTRSKLFSALLVLMIACVSISVTESPVFYPSGIKDFRFSDLTIPSDIPVLGKANLDKFNSYFNQFQADAISYFSKMNADHGRVDKVVPLEFMNLTDLKEVELDFGNFKHSAPIEEFEEKLEPVDLEEDEEYEAELIELEEDEESEIDSHEGKVQVEVDVDDGSEMELDGHHDIEIEIPSAALLVELNETDNSSDQSLTDSCIDAENEHTPNIDAEKENTLNIDKLLIANSQASEIKTEAVASDVQPELVETMSFLSDNDISSNDLILQSIEVDHNSQSYLKDDPTVEDASSIDAEKQNNLNIEDLLNAASQGSEINIDPTVEDANALNIGDNVGTHRVLGISSLVLSLLVASVFFYLKRGSSNKTQVVHADRLSSKKKIIASSGIENVGQEKYSSQNWPTEVDVNGEFPSHTSSFQMSSFYGKTDPISTNEAQSTEKKVRKNRRESLAASEYSLGSPSYGSFTTYERIPIKHASGGEEVMTPVRRSSRIRSHVTSP